MLFSHKDGELRLYSGATPTGCTYYLELLFTDANLSAPIARKNTEERLVMNRGVMDANAHYVQGSDDPIMEPLPLTISCKVEDTTSGVSYLDEWFRRTGSEINGKNPPSSKGNTANVAGTTNPLFVGTKYTYNVWCTWVGSGATLGYKWNEVYFDPGEQTMADAEDGMTLNLNGMIYGTISRATCQVTGVSTVDIAG